MDKSVNSNLPVYNFTHSAESARFVRTENGEKTFLSEEIHPPFLFDSLVLSLNCQCEEDGCVLLEAQLKQRGKWSKFFKLGLFADTFQNSFDAQKDEAGEVAVDVLKAAVAAEAFRFRLRVSGEARVLRAASCVTNASFAYDAAAAVRLPRTEWAAVVLPVSQMELAHADGKRACSPVSLTMALHYLGVPVPVSDVMQGVFDPVAGIYGNWVFNAAYAGRLGLESYVRRFASLEELEDFIAPDCLVLASIGYKKGALSGAAVEETPGHLVLIRGFGGGKILASDPAAPSAREVNRAYDAREFADAWLKNKKGVAYIVRKK